MTSILLYHQIADVSQQDDPMGLAVPPRLFEQQMAYLHRAGYRCVKLGEVVRCLRQGVSLPKKSFVLTFDDGYRDLFSAAWPILNRFGFTATIFLVAEYAGRRSNWDGNRGTHAPPLLSWAEARELIRLGLTFGSHTVTHPRLALVDNKQALLEIQESKEIIQDHLGITVDLFSYPYSHFDTNIQCIVAESGYLAACAGERGAWGLFNLWRAQCRSNESPLSFALKANGSYHQFIRLREQSMLGGALRHTVRVLRGQRSKARNGQDER